MSPISQRGVGTIIALAVALAVVMNVVVVSTTTSTSTTSVIIPIAASTESVTGIFGLSNTSPVALVAASHFRGKFSVDLVAKVC